MSSDQVGPETIAQINELSLNGDPLVLCDVDEVALHFIGPLEQHLADNGFRLRNHTYKLTGNVVTIDGQEEASREDVWSLILSFFEANTATQRPVEGVAAALGEIAERAQVIMLTNIPGHFRQTRIERLGNLGMPFPVVTNTGPKGPTVRLLSDMTGGAVFFLDDAPSNIRSVRDHVPDAELIHFIADKRFFDRSETIEGTHLKSNDWRDVSRYIVSRLA